MRRVVLRKAVARATLFGVACACAVSAAVPATRDPDIAPAARVLFTQIPVKSGSAADLPGGSRIVLFDSAAPARGVRNLTPGFAAAGRPDLSFDGTRILFVGRAAPGDALNVWEMGLGDEMPRQITHLERDAVQAIYLSTLYTLDAVAPERRIAYCLDDGRERAPGVACAALYTCRMDGSSARQITFNPYGVADPYLLGDGRLLHVGALPPDSGGGTALFTVHPDGTDVSAFAAVHDPSALRRMPAEFAEDRVVYVESDPAGLAPGGRLVAVHRSRSLRGRETLAETQRGTYRSPSAFPDGRLLVSYLPPGGDRFGIHLLDPSRPDALVPLFDARDRHDVDAVAVRPRARPAGRSSVVEQDRTRGHLYCMDAYLSDGAIAREIPRGRIATLRVYGLATGGDAASGTGSERLLAEVPVRSDGSFFLRVPARSALRLETTDDAGELLQAMENWIWVMPNEHRGCVGCHEDRERTPPNRHPLALRGPAVDVGRGASSMEDSGEGPAGRERAE